MSVIGGAERAARAGALAAVGLGAHAALNALLLRRPPQFPPTVARRVSVLIPARNEAHRIEPCIRAVLALTGVADLEIVVLDDGSTDGTASVVRGVAGDSGRVRVLEGAAVPDGWLGKPHACAQLAAAATGEYLVFVDADVVAAPHAVAASIALVDRHELAVVSPYPRQEVGSGAERLVQPLLQWLWLTFLPLRFAEGHGPASMTAANGQFLVCRAADYWRCGGHANPSVRGSVVEDVWLARACKGAGGRVAVVDGTALAQCRMYSGWAEVRDGYTKSLWAAFGGAPGALALTVLLGWLYLLAPVALLSGLGARRLRLTSWGAVGVVGGIGGRLVSAQRTGGRRLDAFAHPVSIAALLGLTWRSVWHRRKGRLVWKGRVVGPELVRG